MILTKDIFDFLLQRTYRTVHYGPWAGGEPITDIRLSKKGNSESSLYLSEGQIGPQILTILESDEPIDEQLCGWYLICGTGETEKVVNSVLSVYHHYLQWNYAVHDASYRRRDLQAVSELVCNELDLEINIINREFGEEFSSHGAGNTWSKMWIKDGKIDRESVQEIYASDNSFDQTFFGSDLCSYPYEEEKKSKMYYQNIRINSLLSARLLIVVNNASDHPGELALLKRISNEIIDCYQRQNQTERTYERINQIYNIWKDLMQGADVSEDVIDPLLSKIGWCNQDQYQMVYLQPIGYQQSKVVLNYYALQLENYFSACLAMQSDEGIFLICNKNNEISEDFIQRLTIFARDNLFKTGTSNVFTQFIHCCKYGQQAMDALAVGQKKHPAQWNYAFSSYLYEFLLDKCKSFYPPEDYCPRSLQALRDYDQEHPEVCLMETLYQYIRCGFNASTAAEKLYIHRTTFSYRMRKITSIAEIDLSNWEDLFCIMVYFSMEDRQANIR